MKIRFSAVLIIFLLLFVNALKAEEGLLVDEAANYYSQAQEMYKQGRAQEAIHYYQKAMLMNSSFAKNAYNNMGVIFAQMAKHDKAEYNFKKALEHAPDDIEIKINLGLLYEAQGEQEKADEWWLEAYDLKEIRPDDLQQSQVSDEEYFTVLGLEQSRTGHYATARNDFHAALEKNKDFKPAQANMAITYENQGNDEDALKWWAEYFEIQKRKPKDFVQIQVTDEEWFTKKGLMLAKDDNYLQAIKQFNMAVAANPNYKPAQFNLAICFERIDMQEQANRWWVRAFGLDKRHSQQYTFNQ